MASRTPNFDAKVKIILSALKPGELVCELTGEKWMMTEEEIGWYKKFNVPPSCIFRKLECGYVSYDLVPSVLLKTSGD